MKEKEIVSVIKVADHPNSLKNYFGLYFRLVRIPAIIMIVFIPLALTLAIYGMITGIIYAILCILLYVLSGLCSFYLIMFNIISPIRAFNSSKKLDKDETTITIYENKIAFHSVFNLVSKSKKERYVDDNEIPFESFKKIIDKDRCYIVVTKKEYGNYAFYLWKDAMDEKGIELVKSKIPTKK